MKAMELNGTHIGQLLMAGWKSVNKDGTPRANARENIWYFIPRTLMHKEDGAVRVTGYWFTKQPSRNVRKKVWNLTSLVSTHPDAVPFYAEVVVIPYE